MMMPDREAAVVALGMFDGLHIGHRALLARCRALAETLGALPAAYTFLNHPQTVLSAAGPARLLGAQEKRAMMEALGIGCVCMEPFTRELAALSPEGFIQRLAARWELRALVAGFNYSFGRDGAGGPETLRELGARYGFRAEVLGPVLFKGEPVSSTRIRSLLEDGDARAAADMLGAPYTLCGRVVKNRQIGRRIGFPTANIAPEPGRVLPAEGVYASEARVGDASWRAVTNVGKNPTVGGGRLSIETHLIGFDGELYGRELRVSFLARLRGETRFPSEEALRRQIALDVAAAKALP
ncbi:MAG: bifunctional riboflavin kinase/FAD synthetase [Clostridia bacterium]|nr:bifunctional riboflavin kinase/FAD synthetase [Clostridia bacterium]